MQRLIPQHGGIQSQVDSWARPIFDGCHYQGEIELFRLHLGIVQETTPSLLIALGLLSLVNDIGFPLVQVQLVVCAKVPSTPI